MKEINMKKIFCLLLFLFISLPIHTNFTQLWFKYLITKKEITWVARLCRAHFPDEFFTQTKTGHIWYMRLIYLVDRERYKDYQRRIIEVIT